MTAMPTLDLLCTTDLTQTSNTALHYALRIAERADSKISLLHVLSRAEQKDGAQGEVRRAMVQHVADAGGTERVQLILKEGDPLATIASESKAEHAMVVMGTHGPKGLRQNLFGADILKVVRKLAVPALVVQEGSPLGNDFERIVMPVAGHADIGGLLDAVCVLARLHASEVHVFQLMRPNEQPSEELLRNKLRMLEHLEREGIRHVAVNEPSTVFSVGFADATIRYAERVEAGCLAIMAHASDEYRYIADAEKERLLTNAAFIPVLCA